jgi:hypothetical protein
MHSSNHNLPAHMASSHPRAPSKSAAIRRGELEISGPIPIARGGLDEQKLSRDHGGYGHQSSTSVGKTDTWPRRSTPPPLQDFYQRDVQHASGPPPPTPSHHAHRASAALTTTHQSLSSMPSTASGRKNGGFRATIRRVFGSKRRRETFSAGMTDHRGVSDTNPVCK